MPIARGTTENENGCASDIDGLCWSLSLLPRIGVTIWHSEEARRPNNPTEILRFAQNDREHSLFLWQYPQFDTLLKIAVASEKGERQ